MVRPASTCIRIWATPFWIGDQPSGTQVSGWLDAWTPAPSAYASPEDFTLIWPLGSHVGNARSWWEVEGNPSMIRDMREGAPKDHGWWQGDQEQVGMFLHGFESMWLP
jgi:hypothetical protein